MLQPFRMNRGVVWFWLVIFLAEALISEVGASGNRDAWFKTPASGEEDQQLQYVPTRPRRKHRYIVDTEEKKGDVDISNPSGSTLHQSYSERVSSQEESTVVSQLDKREADSTKSSSNTDHGSMLSFDEIHPPTKIVDTHIYLKNITQLVYYYKEKSINEASKRRTVLDTLRSQHQQTLRTQEDNRHWRNNYATLKARYGRLMESNAMTELQLALIVSRMRKMMKSSFLQTADPSMHTDQSVPAALLHKLLPKTFLSQVKAQQDPAVFTLVRDEMIDSYQLSLDDRDSIIHLLSIELEALQRHSDHWNKDMLSLSERGTELEEEIFRLTMEIRELKREQEMLESKEALLNSTLTRTIDENMILQANIDRYSEKEASLHSSNRLWKGFAVAFALNSKKLLDHLDHSNQLIDDRTEELRHVTEQLNNATVQLGQMHMLKLPQLPTTEPATSSKCIFAKFFYGR